MRKSDKNILLIDDDAINCYIIQEYLKSLNIEASCTDIDDVEKALDYLENCEFINFPNVIFIDKRMPRLNGFDFLERYEAAFYRQYSQTKVIMVTSCLQEEDINTAAKFPWLPAIVSKDNIYQMLPLIF